MAVEHLNEAEGKGGSIGIVEVKAVFLSYINMHLCHAEGHGIHATEQSRILEESFLPAETSPGLI
jgi:hypothetical protein